MEAPNLDRKRRILRGLPVNVVRKPEIVDLGSPTPDMRAVNPQVLDLYLKQICSLSKD